VKPDKHSPDGPLSTPKSILAICCGLVMLYMDYQPYRTGVMHDLGKGFGYFTYAEHPYKFTIGMIMWVFFGLFFILGGILSAYSNVIKAKNKTNETR